jgi:hypothetical protein
VFNTRTDNLHSNQVKESSMAGRHILANRSNMESRAQAERGWLQFVAKELASVSCDCMIERYLCCVTPCIITITRQVYGVNCYIQNEGSLAGFAADATPLKYGYGSFFCNPILFIISISTFSDRLCGLVVRVLGYRSGGSGSILGTTRKKSNGLGTGSTQPLEYK